MYVVLCLIVFGCQYQCNWLPGKTRLWNDLLCVEWDVKPYTLTHSRLVVVGRMACVEGWTFNLLPLAALRYRDAVWCLRMSCYFCSCSCSWRRLLHCLRQTRSPTSSSLRLRRRLLAMTSSRTLMRWYSTLRRRQTIRSCHRWLAEWTEWSRWTWTVIRGVAITPTVG